MNVLFLGEVAEIIINFNILYQHVTNVWERRWSTDDDNRLWLSTASELKTDKLKIRTSKYRTLPLTGSCFVSLVTVSRSFLQHNKWRAKLPDIAIDAAYGPHSVYVYSVVDTNRYIRRIDLMYVSYCDNGLAVSQCFVHPLNPSATLAKLCNTRVVK